MWKWFNCYLSGRHDYGMWCERGAIYLRCMHCGKRSTGWSVDLKAQASTPKEPSRVLPFSRVVAP